MDESIKAIISDLKEDTNLFRLFEEDELEKIAPYFERAHFPADTVIFKEGDPADYIAFVIAGKVEVKKETEFEGKQVILANMAQGSILGEVALFDEQPRSATVETVTETDLLVLNKEAMDKFIDDHPHLGIKMLKGITAVLSLRLRRLSKRLVVIF